MIVDGEDATNATLCIHDTQTSCRLYSGELMQGPDHTQVREMIGAPMSHSSCIVPQATRTSSGTIVVHKIAHTRYFRNEFYVFCTEQECYTADSLVCVPSITCQNQAHQQENFDTRTNTSLLPVIQAIGSQGCSSRVNPRGNSGSWGF